MKPYGREKKVKGSGSWKKDYHVHQDGKRLQNWWEDMCNYLFRSTMKQNVKKEIDKELEEDI
jgi:hypothetical protein